MVVFRAEAGKRQEERLKKQVPWRWTRHELEGPGWEEDGDPAEGTQTAGGACRERACKPGAASGPLLRVRESSEAGRESGSTLGRARWEIRAGRGKRESRGLRPASGAGPGDDARGKRAQGRPSWAALMGASPTCERGGAAQASFGGRGRGGSKGGPTNAARRPAGDVAAPPTPPRPRPCPAALAPLTCGSGGAATGRKCRPRCSPLVRAWSSSPSHFRDALGRLEDSGSVVSGRWLRPGKAVD
jgi:hypothetical protein